MAHNNTEDIHIDPRLFTRLSPVNTGEIIIAPSKTVHGHAAGNADEDAQLRGIAIHRCLELLTGNSGFSPANIRQCLCEELQLSMGDALLDECISEAQQLIANPSLQPVFRPAPNVSIFNECPIHFTHEETMIYGIIDRLLVSEDDALIIDYKSHTQATPENSAQLAQAYQHQMTLYAQGVAKAWPDKKIRAALLFTNCACLHTMSIE